MKNTLSTADLRSYTITTIAAFDEDNVIGSHFVGWQEGFEPSYIEVQFCNSFHLTANEAMEIAEERMRELNRGQDNDSDFLHTRLV